MKLKYVLFMAGFLLLLLSAFVTVSKESIPSGSRAEEGKIISTPYLKDGIDARYPQIILDGSKPDIDRWNQIINTDFNKILKIYSFHPFPEPTSSPSAAAPSILKISYDVKQNDSQYISILYLAAFRSIYSAHPSELAYTTNVNKDKKSRLILSDIIRLNEDFVKDFRTWDFASSTENDREVEQGIRDYIAGITDEDLLMGMKAADKIGSGNLWDIFSYLTPGRLGISIGVPNYLGDHIEFEKEYSRLKDYLNPDFKVPTGK